MRFNKHQPIRANTKLWMTDFCDLFNRKSQLRFTIVDNDKIVARCLVFMEVNGAHL